MKHLSYEKCKPRCLTIRGRAPRDHKRKQSLWGSATLRGSLERWLPHGPLSEEAICEKILENSGAGGTKYNFQNFLCICILFVSMFQFAHLIMDWPSESVSDLFTCHNSIPPLYITCESLCFHISDTKLSQTEQIKYNPTRHTGC